MPRPNFEVFSDSQGKNLIHELTTDKIVPAGGLISFKIFIRNISANEMRDFTLSSDDLDLRFEPKTVQFLAVGQMQEITVIWSPPKTRETALNATISAEYEIIKRVEPR